MFPSRLKPLFRLIQRDSGKVGFYVGVALLALQVVLVVQAQFGASRDFCWAPHTTQVQYSLQVNVGDRLLPEAEIAQRYGLRHGYGWEAHSYQNLINLIQQYEQTYGRSEQARVVLTYRINGHPPRTWSWPQS